MRLDVFFNNKCTSVEHRSEKRMHTKLNGMLNINIRNTPQRRLSTIPKKEVNSGTKERKRKGESNGREEVKFRKVGCPS